MSTHRNRMEQRTLKLAISFEQVVSWLKAFAPTFFESLSLLNVKPLPIESKVIRDYTYDERLDSATMERLSFYEVEYRQENNRMLLAIHSTRNAASPYQIWEGQLKLSFEGQIRWELSIQGKDELNRASCILTINAIDIATLEIVIGWLRLSNVT